MHTCTSAIKPIEREVKVKVENFSKPPCCDVTVLGSLSNNDGDGYENVSLKECSRCFKLYRAYSISYNSSNVGDFFLELNFKWIKVQEKKERVFVWCSRPSQNVTLGSFTSYSCNDGKKSTKKEWKKNYLIPCYWPRKWKRPIEVQVARGWHKIFCTPNRLGPVW